MGRFRRQGRLGLITIAALTSVTLLAGAGAAQARVLGPAGWASTASQGSTTLPGSAHQQWLQRYDGSNGSDVALSMAVSPDGGTVFVTGGSQGTNSQYDFATVAYNAATGAQLWLTRYNGPGNGVDLAASLAVSPDGGTVFVTGGSQGSGTGSDYATIAYNAATGVQLWLSRYNGPGNSDDVSSSLAVSPDGATVFVTGGSTGAGSANDYATAAYDAATGARLWLRRYNGPGHGNDFARGIAVSPSGHAVFVTGGSTGLRSGFDYATIGYNAATGAQLWVRRYNGTADLKDYAHSITVSASTVFVTGSSRDTGTGVDYATVAYRASTGAQLWVGRYTGPGKNTDNAATVLVGPSGNRVFVTGYSHDATSNQDYVTIAYNATTGAVAWLSRYNGTGNGADLTQAMALGSGGHVVYVTGGSIGVRTGFNYAVVAYSAVTGSQLWVRRYAGPGGNDISYAVAVSPGGHAVFITGASEGADTGYDYATVGYRD